MLAATKLLNRFGTYIKWLTILELILNRFGTYIKWLTI